MKSLNKESETQVIYRISHRYNFASSILTGSLTDYLNYESFHFLTHPFIGSVSERAFRNQKEEHPHVEIPLDALRNINKNLAIGEKNYKEALSTFKNLCPSNLPPPDLLIINQASGISPKIMEIFPIRPKTIFYAEFFVMSDFHQRNKWPTPKSVQKMDKPYRQRAITYANNCDAIVVPSSYAKSLWPKEYHHKIYPIFEGIDDRHLDPNRILKISKLGNLIRNRFKNKKLIGYICESIEPIRGFDAWFEAYLVLRKKHKNLHFIVTGTDQIKYGDIGKHEYNGISSFKDWTLKQHNIQAEELNDISWIGTLPFYDYLSLLSVLDVTIYPMYGMFANWSLFNALLMGNPIVSSNKAYLPLDEIKCDVHSLQKLYF